MTEQTVRYQSFLLRLWCDEQIPNAIWRSTVVETLTGEEITFNELNDLVAFLQAASTRQNPSIDPLEQEHEEEINAE